MTVQPTGTREERAERMNTERNSRVLDAACTIAGNLGLASMTRARVAALAGVANGTVTHAYTDAAGLRAAVMREAVHRPILRVLAQGLAAGDAIALDAPDDLKRQALDSLTA